jgi:hypothetical protein
MATKRNGSVARKKGRRRKEILGPMAAIKYNGKSIKPGWKEIEHREPI